MSGVLIFIVLLFIGLFILGRQLSNWYFRIDERIELMKSMNRKLDEISRKLGEEKIEPKYEIKGTVKYKQ